MSVSFGMRGLPGPGPWRRRDIGEDSLSSPDDTSGQFAGKERTNLGHRHGHAFTIIKVHVRGTLDDEQLLVGRGCLGVQLLAVPQRSRFRCPPRPAAAG